MDKSADTHHQGGRQHPTVQWETGRCPGQAHPTGKPGIFLEIIQADIMTRFPAISEDVISVFRDLRRKVKSNGPNPLGTFPNLMLVPGGGEAVSGR
jgi:hypothetical protein